MQTELLGQTKIAVPSATIQFADIRSPKHKRIESRRLAKFKGQRIKRLKGLVKQNTSLSKEKINHYQLVFQGLDSLELERIYSEIEHLSKQESVPLDIHNGMTRYNKDSLKSLKRRQVNRLTNVPKEFNDQLPADSAEYQKLYQLNDSSLISKSEWSDYGEDVNQIDSLKSFQNPSLRDSLIGIRIEQHLESFVKEKIKTDQLNEFNNQPATPQSQVQHYVASLEKFDYKKPEIPEKNLSKALLEQQKERRKQELLDQLNPNSAKEKANRPGTLSRFAIGGYMRYDAVKNSLELTPMITYAPVKKITLGVGYQTNISLSGSDSLNTEGWRVFTQYAFYSSYYVHAESEWVKRKSIDENTPAIAERNTYLGLGKSFEYKFLKSSITALYNLNAPSDLRTRKFTIRIGLTISK